MKSDTTTTALNFVLGVLVLLGVVFALLTINRTRELRQLTVNATLANNALMRAQGLANDTAAYNVSAKSPELTRILQAIQPKTAATK
jgi:beta-lactam-binding protein with PASTA domain